MELNDAGDAIRASVAVELKNLMRLGYGAIVFLRGTFVGVDPLGVARKVSRLWPEGAERLKQSSRRVIDRMAGDAGNYGEGNLSLLRAAAEGVGDLQIVTVNWSGENHHAGRADGAVRLSRIVEEVQRSAPAGSRCLIIGHSHGGNVAAIASQLWSEPSVRWKEFVHAARTFYRSPLFRLGGWWSRIDLPTWEWAANKISGGDFPHIDARRCAIVTLGTPVRYGWGVSAGLLHFIHHGFPSAWRPEQVEREALWKAVFPPAYRSASPGDMVQQIGIAGTNFPPSWISYRARVANARLGRLLQPHTDCGGRLLQRLRTAPRLHDTGLNLLVDYQAADKEADDLLGHAVYTRRHWLPFHFQQIARNLAEEDLG